MSICQPIKFTEITRLRFLAIRARVRAQATEMTVDGDSGTASGQTMLGKVKFSYSYDEASQTLTAQCLEKPGLVSEAKVAAKMRDLMEAL
jgi:hypothetical protein